MPFIFQVNNFITKISFVLLIADIVEKKTYWKNAIQIILSNVTDCCEHLYNLNTSNNHKSVQKCATKAQ